MQTESGRISKGARNWKLKIIKHNSVRPMAYIFCYTITFNGPWLPLTTYSKPYIESRGHVNDDVTRSQKVKVISYNVTIVISVVIISITIAVLNM